MCRYHYLHYLHYLNYTNTQVGRHLRRGRHQEDDRALRLRPHGAVSQCGHGGGSRYLQLYLQSHYLPPVRWSSTSRLETSSPCSARWTMTASTWRSCAASVASCPGKTTFTALLYNNILQTYNIKSLTHLCACCSNFLTEAPGQYTGPAMGGLVTRAGPGGGVMVGPAMGAGMQQGARTSE